MKGGEGCTYVSLSVMSSNSDGPAKDSQVCNIAFVCMTRGVWLAEEGSRSKYVKEANWKLNLHKYAKLQDSICLCKTLH